MKRYKQIIEKGHVNKERSSREGGNDGDFRGFKFKILVKTV